MTPEGGIVMDDRIADMSPRNEEGNGDSPITVRTTMKPHVGSRMIAASVALGTAFALIAPSSALAGDATPAARRPERHITCRRRMAMTATPAPIRTIPGRRWTRSTPSRPTLSRATPCCWSVAPRSRTSICTSRTRREPPTRPSPSPITATPPPTGHRGERRQGQPVVPELPCVGRQPPEQGHRLLGHPAQGRVVHHGEEPGDHQ